MRLSSTDGRYLGEVVGGDELDRRMQAYEMERNRYAMALGDGEFVDATRKAGLARFLNHSCDPNCYKQRILCDHMSRLPRIAFFTLRDIQPLEELTYDYGYADVPGKTVPCLCGSWNCKKLLY